VAVMGTADSFTGSGGAWNGAGDDLMDWLDSLPDGPPSGDPQSGDPNPLQEPGDGESPQPGLPDPEASPVGGLAMALRGVARALRGDGGAGGGGGRGRSGGGNGESGASGGGRTSRAAGRVGGRAAAGVAALRAGDTAGLRALGLNSDELNSLASDYAKAARIAEAAAEGAPTSIQDEELRKAAAATAIWGLQQPEPPVPADLVRRFVEEYLYRVLTVEFGSRLRDGSADGGSSLPTEQTLRSTIRGMIRNLPVTDTGSGHVDLGNAIESTYDRVLAIWAADE
jgi:hypothetical protein